MRERGLRRSLRAWPPVRCWTPSPGWASPTARHSSLPTRDIDSSLTFRTEPVVSVSDTGEVGVSVSVSDTGAGISF